MCQADGQISMLLTDGEFRSILDEEKLVRGPITWNEDEDHSPALRFRADVESRGERPMFVCGYCNMTAGKLSLALILRTVGRIYALDIGRDHDNPGRGRAGVKHKHSWSERYQDKEAYMPEDITSGASDPISVWRQFCTEARIRHDGEMRLPESTRS